MSDMTCLHCGATTSNGLVLCELCRRSAAIDLDYLPVYFRNLARWRPPARPNGSLGTTGQWMLRRGETERSSIANALDRASNDVETWARMLHDDRPGFTIPEGDSESETFQLICLALSVNLTSVGTLEWAGEFVKAMGQYEALMRNLTESYVPGWYAGECLRCKAAPTYVVPGLTWVTCRACGATTYARDHVETVLTEARGWVARPMRLAEAIVALVDTEESVPRLHKRISKWGEREQVESFRKTEYAPKRFRMGEVLDLVFAEGPTRAEVTEDADARTKAS